MLDFCINLWYNIRINKMKGNTMSKMSKDYDVMKSKVDKLLDEVYDLIADFDNKYESDISNDINYEIESLKDRISDNACDYVDDDEEVDSDQVTVFDKSKNIYYNVNKDELK